MKEWADRRRSGTLAATAERRRSRPREEMPMLRLLAVVPVLALVAAPGPAAADDKDKPALSGTWTREANGLDLKFEFAKDTFKVSAFAGENGVVATCKYTVEKDGTVKAT